MDIHKAIITRRSIFPAEYTNGELSPGTLRKILDSARWAPTHKKTQPWRFKAVTGEGLSQLGDFMIQQYEVNEGKPAKMKLKKLKQKMEFSAAVVLIFMRRQEKESIPEWEEIAATSMAVQNMWLTAHALGYGAYWSSPKAFADMSQWDAITTSNRDRFLGFFYIGDYDKDMDRKQPKRLELDEVVEFVE